MNIIISFLLFFLLTFQVHANTIYNLIQIPNLEIYETDTPNKLRYLYAKQPFTIGVNNNICLLYTSPSPRDLSTSRMPSSA